MLSKCKEGGGEKRRDKTSWKTIHSFLKTDPFLKTATSTIYRPPASTLKKLSGFVGGSGDRRAWEGFRLMLVNCVSFILGRVFPLINVYAKSFLKVFSE